MILTGLKTGQNHRGGSDSLTNVAVTGLTPGSTYYFAVLVGDNQQNTALYVPAQEATLNPMWSQQAYLKAASAEANDFFGYSVSVSGDTIVVGAISEASNQNTITNGTTASANNSANAAGAAYVFVRSGSIWSRQAYLKAPNPGEYNDFGWSVSVSGDTIVVGAISEDSDQTTITNGATASGDNSASNAGAAYVFVRQ